MENCFHTDRNCSRNGGWSEMGMRSVGALQKNEQISISSVIARSLSVL